MTTQDFKTVTYLGIKERKVDEIEFFVSTPNAEMMACKTKTKNNARKEFLESLHVGTPIQIYADFNNDNNINVLAFMI